MKKIEQAGLLVNNPGIRKIKDILIKVKKYIYYNSNLVLWSVKLENYSKPNIDENGDIRFKQLDREDLNDIKRIFGTELANKYSKWLSSYYGFIIIYQNNIAGYSWGADSVVVNQGLPPFLFTVHPNEGYCYGFGDFVLPEMRGKGLNSILAQYRLYKMKKKGLKREFGFVDIKNIPQTKIMKKIGWEQGGNLHFIRQVGRTTIKTSGIEKLCRISYASCVESNTEHLTNNK